MCWCRPLNPLGPNSSGRGWLRSGTRTIRSLRAEKAIFYTSKATPTTPGIPGYRIVCVLKFNDWSRHSRILNSIPAFTPRTLIHEEKIRPRAQCTQHPILTSLRTRWHKAKNLYHSHPIRGSHSNHSNKHNGRRVQSLESFVCHAMRVPLRRLGAARSVRNVKGGSRAVSLAYTGHQ